MAVVVIFFFFFRPSLNTGELRNVVSVNLSPRLILLIENINEVNTVLFWVFVGPQILDRNILTCWEAAPCNSRHPSQVSVSCFSLHFHSLVLSKCWLLSIRLCLRGQTIRAMQPHKLENPMSPLSQTRVSMPLACSARRHYPISLLQMGLQTIAWIELQWNTKHT